MYVMVLVFLVLAVIFMLSALKAGRRSNMGSLKKFIKLSASMVGLCTVCVFVNCAALAAGEAAVGGMTDNAMGFLAAALSTGIASAGAGYAVGVSASAAIGAISENEKLTGKALIFVAMGEGIALYGVLIAFMILNKMVM